MVRRGTATARPEYAHTVHVDVRGLRAWRHYFYRFRAAGQISPVGRTRTAPAPTDQPAVTMAVASCQAFYDGFYAVRRPPAPPWSSRTAVPVPTWPERVRT